MHFEWQFGERIVGEVQLAEQRQAQDDRGQSRERIVLCVRVRFGSVSSSGVTERVRVCACLCAWVCVCVLPVGGG